MAKRILMVCVFLCAFSSVLPMAAAWASDLAEIKREGKLSMLCFPHMESIFVRPDLDALRAFGGPLVELKEASAYHGMDIELMGAFAEQLGVELEVVPIATSYADLIPALLDGKGHIVASSLTITEARLKSVDFSRPYFNSWVVVGVPPNSPIRSLEDLPGHRGAVMKGSSQLEYLQSLKLPDVELMLTSYALENTAALEEGEVDFALFDSPAEIGELLQPGLSKTVIAFRLRAFGYGVALRPGSDIKAELDRFIEGLESSGRLAEILERHQR